MWDDFDKEAGIQVKARQTGAGVGSRLVGPERLPDVSIPPVGMPPSSNPVRTPAAGSAEPFLSSEFKRAAAWLRKEAQDLEQRRLEKCAKLAMALIGLETLRKKIHEG
jgi:hypothetical protein